MLTENQTPQDTVQCDDLNETPQLSVFSGYWLCIFVVMFWNSAVENDAELG